jgi:hypothetical protein
MAEDYIYRKGASPNTKVAVSQKNKIFSFSTGSSGEMNQMGNLASFDLNESRGVDPVRGVGFGDHVAELVPSVTEPMTISSSRAMLYLQFFHQVLGYKGGAEGLVRSLKHHRWPFDIKQELVLSHLADSEASSNLKGLQSTSGDSAKAIITYFEACWLTSYNSSYPADSAIVNEDIEIIVSDVLDNASGYNYSELLFDNDMSSIDKSSDIKRSIRYSKTTL